MTLLIVGIDPGTTAAYAILDQNGKFLASASGKEFLMSEMIADIISLGKPIIVACDKSKTPGFVQSLATKLGARLSHPRGDLLVFDKRTVVKDYDVKINAHETDAMASAVIAFLTYKAFFDKMDRFLQRRGREDLNEEFKYFMVRNDQLSFDKALNQMLANKQGKTIVEKIPRQRQTILVDKNMLDLQQKIALLADENINLKKLLSEKDNLISKLQKRISKEGRDGLITHKDDVIRHFSKRLRFSDRTIQEKNNAVIERDKFIARLDKGVLVKKLNNLSVDEFEKKKFLEIKEGDVLYVKNIGVQSRRVLDELKGKVNVILTDKIPQRQNQDFLLARANEVILEESDNYALADKKGLEEAVNKKEILKNIVESYRRERVREQR